MLVLVPTRPRALTGEGDGEKAGSHWLPHEQVCGEPLPKEEEGTREPTTTTTGWEGECDAATPIISHKVYPGRVVGWAFLTGCETDRGSGQGRATSHPDTTRRLRSLLRLKT